MNSTFKTEQEKFWAGEFGSKYTQRNRADSQLASNVALFSKIMARTHRVDSILEFGANIGMNLRAIRCLYPSIELSAIEINQDAIDELRKFQELRFTINLFWMKHLI